MMDFGDKVLSAQPDPLTGGAIDVLQVNLGYRCNMACRHCHLASGPGRSEEMGKETIEEVLYVLRTNNMSVLDVTGGSPELNPHFNYLVKEASGIGVHISVRTNLTIFFEEGKEYLPDFYADHSVEVIASLPCYTEGNVDNARGEGTFRKSIAALAKLNSLGYGRDIPEKRLNLVYNPSGPFLAGPQASLEQDYKHRLLAGFDITFDRLYVFSNSPVGRFRDDLLRAGRLETYLESLEAAFNPGTLGGLMCRHMINVGWDGTLYDCDFNQALGLTVDDRRPKHLKDFDQLRLAGRVMAVGNHCYACTAGQGST